VIAILLSLWAAVGIVAVLWLVWMRQRRLAKRQSVTAALSSQNEDWIYGDRAERLTRRRPTEPTEEAKLEAEAIVADAKVKAQEILAGAERVRDHVEAELAREQAQVAEKSKRLSEFLANALEEVERASANGSASAQDVGKLEALRDELRGAE
jgi:vacuolar-type H+-ATPase subunit H